VYDLILQHLGPEQRKLAVDVATGSGQAAVQLAAFFEQVGLQADVVRMPHVQSGPGGLSYHMQHQVAASEANSNYGKLAKEIYVGELRGRPVSLEEVGMRLYTNPRTGCCSSPSRASCTAVQSVPGICLMNAHRITLPQVIATDGNEEQLRNVKPAPNVSYKFSDAHSIQLQDGCADLITAASALHWFEHDRWEQATQPDCMLPAWCSVPPCGLVLAKPHSFA
jgi:hypothetical protein